MCNIAIYARWSPSRQRIGVSVQLYIKQYHNHHINVMYSIVLSRHTWSTIRRYRDGSRWSRSRRCGDFAIRKTCAACPQPRYRQSGCGCRRNSRPSERPTWPALCASGSRCSYPCRSSKPIQVVVNRWLLLCSMLFGARPCLRSTWGWVCSGAAPSRGSQPSSCPPPPSLPRRIPKSTIAFSWASARTVHRSTPTVCRFPSNDCCSHRTFR